VRGFKEKLSFAGKKRGKVPERTIEKENPGSLDREKGGVHLSSGEQKARWCVKADTPT